MLCSTLLGGKNESQSIQNPNLRGIRFLIILNNDEFQQRSCWFYASKPEIILQNANIFPGKLEVFSFNQFLECSHRYSFYNEKNNSPKKNRLYIRTPKEKKYVLLEEFTKRWINSQLNELNLLFLKLNAECVKITAIGQNPVTEKSLTGIHPGVDEYVVSMGLKNHNSIEIRYAMPTEMNIFDANKYFYLNKWLIIISSRLNEHKYYNEYYFKYTKPTFLNKEFYNNLKTWEIQYEDIDNIDSFELYFEIFYYPDEML